MRAEYPNQLDYGGSAVLIKKNSSRVPSATIAMLPVRGRSGLRVPTRARPPLEHVLAGVEESGTSGLMVEYIVGIDVAWVHFRLMLFFARALAGIRRCSGLLQTFFLAPHAFAHAISCAATRTKHDSPWLGRVGPTRSAKRFRRNPFVHFYL